MPAKQPVSHDEPPIRVRQSLPVASLKRNKPTRFSYQADLTARQDIAKILGLLDLSMLHLKGEVVPSGKSDFTLQATLDAKAAQPCDLTLAPVVFEYSGPVLRRYLAHWEDSTNDSTAIVDDDTIDPLPNIIDIRELAIEALSLALPLYPRSSQAQQTHPSYKSARQNEQLNANTTQEERTNPFSALADLKDQIFTDKAKRPDGKK